MPIRRRKMGCVRILVQRHAGCRAVAHQEFARRQQRARRKEVRPAAPVDDIIQRPAAQVNAAGTEVRDLDPLVIGIRGAVAVPVYPIGPGQDLVEAHGRQRASRRRQCWHGRNRRGRGGRIRLRGGRRGGERRRRGRRGRRRRRPADARAARVGDRLGLPIGGGVGIRPRGTRASERPAGTSGQGGAKAAVLLP